MRTKTMKRTGAVAVALLLAAGCGGDDDDDAAVDTTTTEVAPSTTTTELAPLDVASIPATDRPFIEIELVGDPDAIAADETRVWIRLATGEIVGLDPTTGAEVARFDAGPDECDGIGAGFGSVWTCNGSDVVRLDAVTGAVVATIAAEKTTENLHLVAADDRMWILVGDGHELVSIDPETNELGEPIDVGVHGTDLAVGPSGIWVYSVGDDKVVGVDIDRGEVTTAIDVDEPRAVAAGEDTVWIATPSTLLQVDADTSDVVSTVAGGVLRDGSIAAVPDGVWIRNQRTALHHVVVDGADAEVVERIPIDDLTSGGTALYAFGAVWATSYDDGLVLRVDAGAA